MEAKSLLTTLLVGLLLLAILPVPASGFVGVVTEALHADDSGNDLEGCGDSDGHRLIRGGVKWRSFPVTYSLDASVPGDFTDPIRSGFQTWDDQEHPAGDFFAEVTDDGNIDVLFASIDGTGGILAVASISFNIVTKTIVEASITFDGDDAWTVYDGLSCDVETASGFDVVAVATHEIGHTVGLDHSDKSNLLTMYPYYIGTKARTLALGDEQGFAELYADGGDDDGGPPSCHPVFGC